jgi:hypothetical protein
VWAPKPQAHHLELLNGVEVTPSQPTSTVAHHPKNDETPDNAEVLKYRYRDSKPPSGE